MSNMSRDGWWRLGLAAAVVAVAIPAAAAQARGRGPAGKISHRVDELARRQPTTPLDVIVRFKSRPGNTEQNGVLAAGGRVRRHFRSSRWMAVRLPPRGLSALGKSPAVEFIASDPPLTVAMDVARQAADAPVPDSPRATLRGAGVTIAMVDTGVAPSPEISNLLAAVDFVDPNSPATVDPHGHGTHVAGVLVGNGVLSQGRIVGIAPEANLVSVRVLDGTGSGQASDLLAALQWVLENKNQYGIRVLNLSLGHPVYEPAVVDPLVEQVEALWHAGIVVVCSAGNDGRSGDATISSPCNARDVISVGALNDHRTPDTADDTVASYSALGPTRFDLTAKPDLVAPGNRVVSLRSAGSYLDTLHPELRVAADPSLPDVVDYFQLSGTSMSAPVVAGAAALMLEQEPTLAPPTVKARLMVSARKASAGNPLATGAGALDIEAALQATDTVTDAPSPRVIRDDATQQLGFENTAVLWGNPALGTDVLWSQAIVWSSAGGSTDPTLWSSGILWLDPSLWPYAPLWPDPATLPDATFWSEALLWSEATLWCEATIWAEALMWPEYTGGTDPQSIVAPDP